MYYFAGVYKINKNKIFSSGIDSLFFGIREKDKFLFSKNNFSVGYCASAESRLNFLAPQFFLEVNKTAIIFEGRITNTKELEDIFKMKSLDLISYSNIILKLYENYNLNFLPYLKGSFAFAICDFEKDKLILHRDRIGNKPLYYYNKNGLLVFGTQMKPITRYQSFKKEINAKRIYNFFYLRALSEGDDTEFKNIYNLLPGSILVVEKNKISQKPIQYKDKYNITSLNGPEIVDFFYEILNNIFKKYYSIYGKSPIAFSGGLDTNVIINFAKKNNVPIETYTVNFKTKSKIKNKDYNLAKKRSQYFNAAHHELKINADIFLENFEFRIKSFDRLIRLNYLNNDSIFEFIAKNNNLVFTGDGVEEQLGYYAWHNAPFYADLLLKNYFRNLDSFRRYLARSCYNIFFSLSKEDFGLWENKFFSKYFFKKLVSYKPVKYIENCFSKARSRSFLKRGKSTEFSLLNDFFYVDFFNIFSNKIIATDTIARKYSIEICSPFLDEDFVFFLNHLPVNLKCKNSNPTDSKFIFRKAVSKLIGDKEAFFSFKSGSDIPYTEWLLMPHFEKKVKDILRPSRINKSGVIDANFAKKIINEHYRNRQLFENQFDYAIQKKGYDYRFAIYNLISFQLWWEEYFT